MSDQLRESLSAVMDDEADAFELRRLLDEASADTDLREEWHRMHLVRDVLRGENFDTSTDLRNRLLSEMEEEVDGDEADTTIAHSDDVGPVKNKQALKSPWIGRLTGTAVALVAAVAVLFSANIFSPQPDGQIATNNSEILNAAQLTVPVMYTEATAQDRMRMDARRMEHYQSNALNKAGAVSFVRMVTFRPMVGAASSSQKQPNPQNK